MKDIIEGVGGNLTVNSDISLQNGNYSLVRDVKVSFNNNEVEHNREPLFTTSYLNLLEYSDDYTKSIALQHGFYKQISNEIIPTANPAPAIVLNVNERRAIIRGVFDAATNRFPITLTIPLKHISNFFRRLDFPIMNQLSK